MDTKYKTQKAKTQNELQPSCKPYTVSRYAETCQKIQKFLICHLLNSTMDNFDRGFQVGKSGPPSPPHCVF